MQHSMGKHSMGERSMGILPTANASRYLQQLCKHWSHKFDVQFDKERGHIALPAGTADLQAGDMALTITCAVPQGGDMARLQQVVADHLQRFAFREPDFAITWGPA